jgi:hypothetical protein
MRCKEIPFESLFELYNVVLFEHPKHLDLSKRGLLYYFILIRFFELLNRN